MSIERLGQVDPVSAYNKNNKNSNVDSPTGNDSILLSKEAQNKAELLKLSESVQQAPDIREDRVAEVREKLKDPSYINDAVISEVADRLLDIV